MLRDLLDELLLTVGLLMLAAANKFDPPNRRA
jgi:hypothetical protein